MRQIMITLGLVGGLVCAADVAAAQYYYGPGYGPGYYRHEGRPPHRDPGHYNSRWYHDPGFRAWARQRERHSPYYTSPTDPNVGCPKGWTRQAGACKPYRGY